ncbi:MAG: acyltransferase family protein [Fimbriimonas sp.]
MRRRPAPASLPVTRLAFLEGLRGLAALYVVVSHFCSMADGRRAAGWVSNAPEWLYRVMGTFWYGNLAVAAFIVLSGFCLQLSLFSRTDGKIANLKVFYKRRAWRILPPYYAALAFSIAVALLVTQHQKVPPFDRYVPVTVENVMAHIFLVHNFVPAWMYKINGVLWSIAIEAQLYVVFPLLVLAIAKLGRVSVLAICSAIAWVVVTYIPVAPKLYPWYLPLFVLGMVSAHLAYRPNLTAGTLPWLARLLGCAALGGTIGAAAQDAPLHVQDPFVGVAVACLCYVLTTTTQGPVIRAASWGPLVKLGSFSYSLYLVHHPIQQMVFVNRPEFVQGELGSLLYLLGIGLPIILAGSYLFYLAFEKPFLPRRSVSKLDLLPTKVPLSLPLRTYAGPPAPPPPGRVETPVASVVPAEAH